MQKGTAGTRGEHPDEQVSSEASGRRLPLQPRVNRPARTGRTKGWTTGRTSPVVSPE